MRVLVVTTMYPPHAYGGYEYSCRDVAERWQRDGDEVTVLTSDLHLPGRTETEGPVPVRRQLRLYWRDHRVLHPPVARRLAVDCSNVRSVREALRDVDPDVVSVWAMGALSLGVLSELAEQARPTVLVICDEWPVYGPELDAWLRLFVHRPRLGHLVEQVSRRHGRVRWHATLPPLDTLGPACFVSDFLRERARHATSWTFPVSAVVHSGIDTSDFPLVGGVPGGVCAQQFRAERTPAREAHSGDAPSGPPAGPSGGSSVVATPLQVCAGSAAPLASPWRWRLLYVGRIDPRKGIASALRALAACPTSATLAVHGTGDEVHLHELRQLAGELGIAQRVTFTSTPRHQLADVYRQADALIFPSTWEEPFGLVPVEAMACGLPVVACRVGGAAEFLVHEGNCLEVPPDDPAAIAAALRRLAGAASLRQHLVDGGRATAAQLDVERLARLLRAWNRAALEAADAGARDRSAWPCEQRLELPVPAAADLGCGERPATS